jgi:hypothetical protein
MRVLYAKSGGLGMNPSGIKTVTSLLAVLLLAVTAHAQAPAAPTLQDFAWLAGHWRIEKPDGLIDEQWMAPAGGLMMGMARTIQAGKVREHEFTLLRQEANGDIVYVASPSKQTETTFKLTSLRDGEAVFENPQHDFPKRVIYTRKADDSLLAAIEGPGRDGKVRRVEYPFKRVTP